MILVMDMEDSFFGSIIYHGTSIPVIVRDTNVYAKDEHKSWIPFSCGRSGGPVR